MTSAHNFTQNPYEPDWQIPLGVRASGYREKVKFTEVAPP